MSELRKVVDARDARACLSAMARSGETLREWSRRNQIDGRSLRAWQINLSRGSRRASTNAKMAKAGPATLVELVPVSMTTRAARYVVRVEDVAVEIGDDFDTDTLGRILGVLRSC